MSLGIKGLEESSTYQAILEEGAALGEVREARRLLVELGSDRLGAPDTHSVTAIQNLGDLGRLHSLIRRAHSATSWQDLLSNAER